VTAPAGIRVEQWFATQPQPPAFLVMPRDALFEIQGRLAGQLSLIRDPASLPILLRLLQNPHPYTRQAALQAVRTIKSPKSVPALLRLLDDSTADNAFIAMQALIELAGGGPISWMPTLLEFRKNPTYYAAMCRSWWEAGHQPDQ